MPKKKAKRATKLGKKLAAVKRGSRKKQQTESLWKGPEVDGITQSLLGRFLACRERFRLLVVDGLTTADDFNHRLEYGNMWHLCEEAYAAKQPWEEDLRAYVARLCSKYRHRQEQVAHWYEVCRAQFPIYAEFWAHYDKPIRPVSQEEVFAVPYTLPSKRVVLLKGKWDSVDIVGTGKNARMYLQENKTKGDIDEQLLRRQLQFDLQTNVYLIALKLKMGQSKTPLAGVRYNVVRRPLSGGRGSIRQRKPTKSNPKGESSQAFYARLAGLIEDDPGYFFMRWTVEFTSEDLERFQTQFLTPILEQLCDWWEWISSKPDNIWIESIHWRHPFGVYNPMNEGRASEMDEYLASGSKLGLVKATTLFPEL